MANEPGGHRLKRPIDEERDHLRGGRTGRRNMVVTYGDYLCPYCRRLSPVLERLRQAMGQRVAYVYRHFPNERAHPGATLMSIGAEAAGRQDRFWEMHDALFGHDLPLDRAKMLKIAASLGLDMARFERDLDDPALREHVEADLADGKATGVTATPTIFVDGVRYDGAWDFYSMLEGLERPVGAQMRRTARAFANLPASAGIALLAAALLALVLANSPFAGLYTTLVRTQIGVGPLGGALSLSVAEWCSEGLLAIFFLILGLEMRREARAGSFDDWRALAAPGLAAIGAAAAPAVFYLALNPGPPTSGGWAVAVDTGLAFTLGILALFGRRASPGLKLFVATYGVLDDLLTTAVLIVVHPGGLHLIWLAGAAAAIAAMVLFNRWRVYSPWPYVVATVGLWLALHLAGVSGAVSGVALALFLPPRPAPTPGPLLAQAASALAELEHAEHDLKHAASPRRLDQLPVWDWASRNLSAAAERLLSPAERAERAVEPWSTYVVLPLFAFTAAGVPLAANLAGAPALRVFLGVALGLALAKPAGIVVAVWLAQRVRLAVAPDTAAPLAFIGAAFLCGIGDPLSLLLAEQALPDAGLAAAAKIGVLAGSALAAALGAATLALSGKPVTSS